MKGKRTKPVKLTSAKQRKKSAIKIPGKSTAVTMKGLTVLLTVFPMRGREKSVIWMKGWHLPLTNKIRNNHLFHDVPAGVQLRLQSQNQLCAEPESMSPAPLHSPHNEDFCLYLHFHLAGRPVVSLYPAVWRL